MLPYWQLTFVLHMYPCSQLQATGVLCTPWPTPAHEEQMRAKYEAAAAAEAAAQVRAGEGLSAAAFAH